MIPNCTMMRHNKVAFEVKDNQVTVHSKIHKKNLESIGIPIPIDLRKFFDGKRFITPKNSLFAHAFILVYVDSLIKASYQLHSELSLEKMKQDVIELCKKRKHSDGEQIKSNLSRDNVSES